MAEARASHFSGTELVNIFTHSKLPQVKVKDLGLGLLRQIAMTFRRHQRKFQVTLNDSECQTALAVFYLTSQCAKLTELPKQLLQPKSPRP